jgi:hypothetical protein
MGLTAIVTNAGRAALVNAANTGTRAVTIARVGLTGSAVTPEAGATVLPGQFKTIATLSGDVVADDTIHLIVRDESADVFTVRSLALYLDDGTLFAIYGQADVLIEKSAQALMLLAIDIRFEDVDAATITFGDTTFLNPPATTERQGVVELATVAEAQAGIDALRALTPQAARSAILGWLLAQDARAAASTRICSMGSMALITPTSPRASAMCRGDRPTMGPGAGSTPICSMGWTAAIS